MPRTLTVFAETFPLHAPFRISRGVKTAAEVVTVTIGQDGMTGRGEGVPYPRYGESVDSAIAAIETMRGMIEQGLDRQQLLESMPASAARNAVDCALWDLELQLAGSDLATALGLDRPLRPIVTAMTISLDTPDNMARAAAALADAPLLKVKVDRSDPATLLAAVRAAAPNREMIVDPNESWTIDEVRGLQGLMTDLRIDLLEQPLPADADRDLIGFRSAIPIAADESVHVAADLDALARWLWGREHQARQDRRADRGARTGGRGARARAGRDDRLHDLFVAVDRPRVGDCGEQCLRRP